MRSRINRKKGKRKGHTKHNPGERATHQHYIRTRMGRFIVPVKSRAEKDREIAMINRDLSGGREERGQR